MPQGAYLSKCIRELFERGAFMIMQTKNEKDDFNSTHFSGIIKGK